MGVVAAWLWTGSAAATPPPSTAGGSAWGLDARADQLMARIGQWEGETRRRLVLARGAGQAQSAQCISARHSEILANLWVARRARASLRTAMIQDSTAAADAAWQSLQEIERAAHQQAAAAESCHEDAFDRDGDGIPDDVDRAPEGAEDAGEDHDGSPEEPKSHVVALRELEAGVAALKDSIGRSVPRRLLLGTGPGVAPAPAAAAAAAAATAISGPHDMSKIIRTADVTLAVYHVEQSLSAVDGIARELGGYLSLRTDQQVTVRIPRDRFDEAMRRIEALGDVLHRSITAEDVTDEYVDLEMRLRNALVVRARLEKLLETAAVRDAVEIEKELARVTEEIERIEGKLKLLGDRIAYSSITVSFEPSAPQQVRRRALLPFPWMNDVGLSPLLALPGSRK
jgi:hypothetical protein